MFWQTSNFLSLGSSNKLMITIKAPYAVDKGIYSTLVVLKAVSICILDCQSTGRPANMMISPG